MKFKRLSMTLMLLVAMMTAVGCVSSSDGQPRGKSTESKAEEGLLTMSWNKDIGPLNPHLYAPNEWFAQAMVYESLVNYGENGKIEPSLAKSWEISEDGKTYTFHLRQGVLFSDGTALTANQVKRNFDAVLQNAKRHDWLELIAEMKQVEVVDEHTIKIEFNNPYYPVLQELSLIRPLRILGDAGFPEDGSTAEQIKAPIGTGPWVLKAYKKDEYALFVPNEHYWGTKPKLKQVKVKVIPDAQARVMALQKGDIDLIFGSGQLSPDSFKSLQDSGNYQTAISSSVSTRVLAIHSNKGATADLRVRQALEHALNKQLLIDHVFYGIERKADTLFAPELPYSNVALPPYDYDMEKAKQLLDDAGWKTEAGQAFRMKDGESLRLQLAYNSEEHVQKAVAEFMQGEMRKLGIEIELIGEEYQTHVQRQKEGSFNLIFSETWGVPYDPHSVVASMREPSHADYQAQSGLAMKPEIDQWITEALISTSEARRAELYKQLLTTLHEQAVYLPISFTTHTAVYHDRVSKVEFLPMQYEIPFHSIEVRP